MCYGRPLSVFCMCAFEIEMLRRLCMRVFCQRALQVDRCGVRRFHEKPKLG